MGIVITTAHYIPKTSSWMDNCTKFGHFIISKIIKIVATRCEILRRKCIKFDYGWGSAPDPTGSLQRSPDSLGGIQGPTTYTGRRGTGKKGKGRVKGQMERERIGEVGKDGEGKVPSSQTKILPMPLASERIFMRSSVFVVSKLVSR